MQLKRERSKRVLVIAIAAVCATALTASCSSSSHTSTPAGSSTVSSTPAAATPLGVTWMTGTSSPGTPAKYNKVGVIKVGAANAKNVLVLEPGTSAGGAYFVPLAKWIVEKAPDWQVWSVERRENLLEDQTELDAFKHGKATGPQLYNYYLGYLKSSSIKQHFQTIPDASVAFAKQWGMRVAVEDLHIVIAAAQKLGGKVVLGGHSLGGTVVTAYATWDFAGRAGAADLAGLVFIDGGSRTGSPTAQQATQTLQELNAPTVGPWLTFGNIPAPFAGLYNASGSAAALLDPNTPSLGQTSGLLPAAIVPKPRVTNVGQYGYALNVATSPASLVAAQAHLGRGITTTGAVRGWDATGALTPINRYATMFSGAGMDTVDGTEWYFPQRLTDDTAVVDNGNANPAQEVLGVNATMGHDLPSDLLIYAFGAALGGQRVLDGAQLLATQSNIPASNLTLVNRASTYAHNDPAGAYPSNDFFAGLVPFLDKVNGA